MPIEASKIDVLEAGDGPIVVLIHSSVAGARQWRKLSDVLSTNFRVKAINLFGYGGTPVWDSEASQTLSDQAKLVESIIPKDAESVSLVGHSFGGSVAMVAATSLAEKVDKLVLLEPNPFSILRDHGRNEAFSEAMWLRDTVKQHGATGDWIIAAETFADYWGGPGTWEATGTERRAVFAEALKPNFHEWDAVMDETTPLSSWAEHLPASTLVIHDEKTVRPIREIVELVKNNTPWQVRTVPEGGHMAPLTHPNLINPLVAEYLNV